MRLFGFCSSILGQPDVSVGWVRFNEDVEAPITIGSLVDRWLSSRLCRFSAEGTFETVVGAVSGVGVECVDDNPSEAVTKDTTLDARGRDVWVGEATFVSWDIGGRVAAWIVTSVEVYPCSFSPATFFSSTVLSRLLFLGLRDTSSFLILTDFVPLGVPARFANDDVTAVPGRRLERPASSGVFVLLRLCDAVRLILRFTVIRSESSLTSPDDCGVAVFSLSLEVVVVRLKPGAKKVDSRPCLVALAAFFCHGFDIGHGIPGMEKLNGSGALTRKRTEDAFR